jgi:hypothetical protein
VIKNYYYLIAGILGILFSVSHASNGQTTVLPMLSIDTITVDTKTIFFYVWHIITAENMLFGFVFIFMSFSKDLSKVRFTAWVIAILMLVRWIVIFGSTIFYNAEGLKNIWIDSIAIIVYVSIIILGTTVKDKRNEP